LLLGQPVLTALAASATVGAVAGSMQGAILPLYFVRDLHLSAFAIGAAVTVSGVAAVAGALCAPGAGHRFGPGPAYILGQGAAALGGLVLALARAPLVAAAPFLIAGEALLGLGPSLYGTAQRSIRQASVPDVLLGRVNATWRFFVFGAQPLGALVGGGIAGALGLRSVMALGSLGLLAACLWSLRSALRTLRELPTRPA
jgi:MFS family permease